MTERRHVLDRMDTSRPLLRLELSTRGVLVLAAVVIAIWLISHLWSIFVLVIISLKIATSLMPFVDWLMTRGLSRRKAVATVCALFFLIVGALGFLVVPSAVNQARDIANELPNVRDQVAAYLRRHHQFELARQAEQFSLSDAIKRDRVVNTSRQVIDIAFATLTVVVLTIYILLDIDRIERFFYFAVPERYHVHVRNLLPALRTTVGGYIRGQAVTSLTIAVFTFAVLVGLGVPNALTLAVLAGITDIIPLVGAILAVTPSVLAALAVSPTAAIVVGVLLVVYQEFENRILIPRVYGSTLRLPSTAVLLAVLIGAKLAGITGALLALPAAAGLRVLIMYWHGVRQGRVEPVAPEDELLAPDEAEPTPAIARDDARAG